MRVAAKAKVPNPFGVSIQSFVQRKLSSRGASFEQFNGFISRTRRKLTFDNKKWILYIGTDETFEYIVIMSLDAL
jgi:hypothetical protein